MPEPAPPLAWRMGDDRVRTSVGAGIARLVPWLYVRQSEVDAVGFDKEGGDLKHSAMNPQNRRSRPDVDRAERRDKPHRMIDRAIRLSGFPFSARFGPKLPLQASIWGDVTLAAAGILVSVCVRCLLVAATLAFKLEGHAQPPLPLVIAFHSAPVGLR